MFKGSTYSYFPRGFRRFEIALNDKLEPVTGRAGDVPAVQLPSLGDGLNILLHETTYQKLTYGEWDKFLSFVDHKDLTGAPQAHVARGLPQTGFVEVYSRYAKSLVGVGSAKGQDRLFGFETEVLALSNPYIDDMAQGFEAAIFYQGEPRADAQVELFALPPDGTVTRTLFRTDAEGRVRVPVQAGVAYMIDAVVLREPSPELTAEYNAAWESLWANLTFAVPAR